MNSGTLLLETEYTFDNYVFSLSIDNSHEKYKNIIASCRNTNGGEIKTKSRIVSKDSVLESWNVEINNLIADVYVNGNFSEIELPTEIRVTKAPQKIEYNDNELIDFSGIVVTAYCYDGSEWGKIPFQELVFSQDVADAETTKNEGKVLIKVSSLSLPDLEVSFKKITKNNPIKATVEYIGSSIQTQISCPKQGEKMVYLGLGQRNYEDHIWNGQLVDYTPDGLLANYNQSVSTSGAIYGASIITYYGPRRAIKTREEALIANEQQVNNYLAGNANIALYNKKYYKGNYGYYRDSDYGFGTNYPLQPSNTYSYDVYKFKTDVIFIGTKLLFNEVNEIEISWARIKDGRILKTSLCIFVSTDE